MSTPELWGKDIDISLYTVYKKQQSSDQVTLLKEDVVKNGLVGPSVIPCRQQDLTLLLTLLGFTVDSGEPIDVKAISFTELLIWLCATAIKVC